MRMFDKSWLHACVFYTRVYTLWLCTLCVCKWKRVSLKQQHRDKASYSAPSIKKDGEGNMRVTSRQERGVWG